MKRGGATAFDQGSSGKRKKEVRPHFTQLEIQEKLVEMLPMLRDCVIPELEEDLKKPPFSTFAE